jgi:hypothetical protein
MSKGSRGHQRTLDRRRFLTVAGMATAAYTFGHPLAGCSDFRIDIPCLGPAAAPTPVPGTTYIRASELGCALDCDLSTGRNKHTGGAATDDAPLINAAMAGASASHPITLIIDGSAMISGLFLPAGGYWSIAGLGCGTGFYIKTGTNNDGLHNAGPAWMLDELGPPAPARGSSVSLSNFTINGNAGDGTNGDSTVGFVQGNLKTGQECYPINLQNLDNITIENVVVVNSPCYHMRFTNVGNVTISGCVVLSIGPNTDGLHFEGPSNDISISGCSFTTGDDAIALNCPEGYSGDISRVTVNNCTFNSPTLMRLNTIEYPNDGASFYIDTVAVSNCSGTLQNSCFEIGDGAGGNSNAVTGFTISNCELSAPAILNIWANFGDIALKNVTLVPSNSALQAPGYALARTNRRLLYPDSGYYTGSSLTFENCVISGGGSPVAAVIVENTSTIATVEFNGFALQGCSGHGLVSFASGSIGQLIIDSVTTENIQAAVPGGAFSDVGMVSGAGVLATGWKFPDAVMANNVPYISASTGQPSIKINGVVEPYS